MSYVAFVAPVNDPRLNWFRKKALPFELRTYFLNAANCIFQISGLRKLMEVAVFWLH